MGKFSKLNLHWWLEEDLEDLFEKYPELNNMTIEQMNEFARKLYWEAQGYIDQANSIENKADALREYIKAISK